MKRILTLSILALAALFAPSVYSQTVTITSTSFGDTAGNLYSGIVLLSPTLSSGLPTSYQKPGGGTVTSTAIQAIASHGVFSFSVPDTNFTSPAHICFKLTAPGITTGYNCLQPHYTATGSGDWCQAGVCNLDNYGPNVPPQATVPVGPVGPQGPPGLGCSSLPCPVANGGTGATTAAGALTNIFTGASNCATAGTVWSPAANACITGSGSGTVTSVVLTVPSDETVTGSPITSSGTLAVTRNSESANLFLASPSGASGVPSYRAIVAADVPTLNQSTTGNAATATALAAAPSTCSTGYAPTGISANGNATGCAALGSGSGTVTASPQYTVPFYSASGTANTLSGTVPLHVTARMIGAYVDGSHDDTAVLNGWLASHPNQVLDVVYDGNPAHCALISSPLLLTASGSGLEGSTPTEGGICTATPGMTAVEPYNLEGSLWTPNVSVAQYFSIAAQIGGSYYIFTQIASGATTGSSTPSWNTTLGSTTADNTAIWLNNGDLGASLPTYPGNVNLNNLAISYTGAIASGLVASATISGSSISGFTVSNGGTHYFVSPGLVVVGCAYVQSIATISSGVITALTPATGSPILGELTTSGTTGTCIPTSQTWASSTFEARYHSIVVEVSGTYYVFTETATNATTGGSAPSWNTALNSSTTDNTATWLNNGVYGSITAYGGSNGDPTGEASTAWCIDATGYSPSNYNGALLTVNNVTCNQFGGGLALHHSEVERVTNARMNFQDANGYGFAGYIGGNQSPLALGLVSSGPGFCGYIGGGQGIFSVGDCGTNAVAGWDIACQGCTVYGNDNESVQGPVAIVENSTGVSLSNFFDLHSGPSVMPSFVVDGGNVNFDLASIRRSDQDWSMPMVENLTNFAFITGTNSPNGLFGAYSGTTTNADPGAGEWKDLNGVVSVIGPIPIRDSSHLLGNNNANALDTCTWTNPSTSGGTASLDCTGLYNGSATTGDIFKLLTNPPQATGSALGYAKCGTGLTCTGGVMSLTGASGVITPTIASSGDIICAHGNDTTIAPLTITNIVYSSPTFTFTTSTDIYNLAYLVGQTFQVTGTTGGTGNFNSFKFSKMLV